ncbi:hypothetical protein EPZ47_19715 [Pseudomonas viciae]|uniref:Uncharacterized protein n=1 Tax=Pseudomonas viciae TaxID=2505979 RepID=A0A4P7PJ54_9PSED|nr:hypothetical protein EPZ47_19715 [Pseudomonas viciae]
MRRCRTNPKKKKEKRHPDQPRKTRAECCPCGEGIYVGAKLARETCISIPATPNRLHRGQALLPPDTGYPLATWFFRY